MKKVFVSHSSRDKEIVDIFIDKILKLGFCLTSEDIAYTSREDTGVRTGDDIKKFIKDNISGCDFVFFMISDNYAQSQICLNEMGAAWATDRRVIPIVFPNVEFNAIGWLYSVNKGIKLNDTSALDTLFEEVNEQYGHKLKVSAWNRYKGEFIESIQTHVSSTIQPTTDISGSEIEYEVDLLDCREIFDQNIELLVECMGRIGEATHICTENINKNNKHLNNLTNNPNRTVSQARTVMLKFAHDYDALSDVYDKEIPLYSESFEKAMNAGIKMKEFSSPDDETDANDREAIAGMIKDNEEFLEAIIRGKESLENDKTNLDKTFAKSKKRLIKCYNDMIESVRYGNEKANELLNHI